MEDMMDYVVDFHAHGFDPEKDISEEEWELLKAELVTMNNLFANGINLLMDRINDTWERYESIKVTDRIIGSDIHTVMAQLSMGISENDTYWDWLEKWMKDVAKVIDEQAGISGLHIRSNIFRDGDEPMYGVKVKDKPEWTIDFTLKPVVK